MPRTTPPTGAGRPRSTPRTGSTRMVRPKARIAETIGMSRAQLGHVLNGDKRNPSIGTVCKILSGLPAAAAIGRSRPARYSGPGHPTPRALS